jgi:hypothetical protein
MPEEDVPVEDKPSFAETSFTSDVVDTANEAQNALSEASALDPNIQELEQNAEDAQKPLENQIEQTAGLEKGTLSEAVDNPDSPAGKKLTEEVIKPGIDKAHETIKNAQAENGESGKSLADSPKTKMQLLETYGPTILKFLLAISVLGVLFYELHKIAEEMSGCYQFSTTTASTPTKVACSQETCSCGEISNCGPNNTPCTTANGIQYEWRTYTALEALFQIPKLIMDPMASGLSNLLQPLKQIFIGVVIIVILLAIIYLIYKFLNKKISQ